MVMRHHHELANLLIFILRAFKIFIAHNYQREIHPTSFYIKYYSSKVLRLRIEAFKYKFAMAREERGGSECGVL